MSEGFFSLRLNDEILSTSLQINSVNQRLILWSLDAENAGSFAGRTFVLSVSAPKASVTLVDIV